MKVKHITRYSILLALAVILSWVEHLIPLPTLPGIKLGLANAIGILCLYYLGTKSYISTLVSRFTSPAKNSPGLVVIGISGASGASIIVPPAAAIISSA